MHTYTYTYTYTFKHTKIYKIQTYTNNACSCFDNSYNIYNMRMPMNNLSQGHMMNSTVYVKSRV